MVLSPVHGIVNKFESFFIFCEGNTRTLQCQICILILILSLWHSMKGGNTCWYHIIICKSSYYCSNPVYQGRGGICCYLLIQIWFYFNNSSFYRSDPVWKEGIYIDINSIIFFYNSRYFCSGPVCEEGISVHSNCPDFWSDCALLITDYPGINCCFGMFIIYKYSSYMNS